MRPKFLLDHDWNHWAENREQGFQIQIHHTVPNGFRSLVDLAGREAAGDGQQEVNAAVRILKGPNRRPDLISLGQVRRNTLESGA